MLKKFVLLATIAVLLVVGAPALAEETAPQSETTVCFGGRLQHDMTFYLQGGVACNDWDLIAALGFNNAIWLGGHIYLAPESALSGFAGIELHVLYPKNESLKLDPALALGLSFDIEPAVFVIESLLMPVPEGFPIDVRFAISFLFKL